MSDPDVAAAKRARVEPAEPVEPIVVVEPVQPIVLAEPAKPVEPVEPAVCSTGSGQKVHHQFRMQVSVFVPAVYELVDCWRACLASWSSLAG